MEKRSTIPAGHQIASSFEEGTENFKNPSTAFYQRYAGKQLNGSLTCHKSPLLESTGKMVNQTLPG
jgi:hypothetical protein